MPPRSGFTLALRAARCPACGASVPVASGLDHVVCEYCGTSSRIAASAPTATAPGSPLPRGDRPAAEPVAVPHFNPWAILAPIAMMAVIGAATFGFFLVRAPAVAEPVIAVVDPPTAPAPAPAPAPAAIPAPAPIAAPEPAPSIAAEPPAPAPAETRKKSSPPRPDPYDVARAVQATPGFGKCLRGGLSFKGSRPANLHTVIELTVDEGRATKAVVSAIVRDGLDTLTRDGDRKTPVTAADVAALEAQAKACVKERVSGLRFADGELARARGRVYLKFTGTDIWKAERR